MVPFTGSGEELESTMLSLGLGKVRIVKSIFTWSTSIDASIYFSWSFFCAICLFVPKVALMKFPQFKTTVVLG